MALDTSQDARSWNATLLSMLLKLGEAWSFLSWNLIGYVQTDITRWHEHVTRSPRDVRVHSAATNVYSMCCMIVFKHTVASQS